MVKFIILAVAFPILFPGDDFGGEEEGNAGKFIVEHDALRAFVSVIDIIGLYLVINGKRLSNVMGDIDVKLVAVGLGWAAAELASTHFLDIIF